MTRWDKVREDLRVKDTKALRGAIVQVGKILAEDLPPDIAESVISHFSHPECEIRAEAVRAIGIHWRLPQVFDILKDLLKQEDDWHVQISAIHALGALGREHPDIRDDTKKTLAGVALNERFADDERMVAYRELLNLAGRMEGKEYRGADAPLEESLARFAEDRAWIEDVARQVL